MLVRAAAVSSLMLALVACVDQGSGPTGKRIDSSFIREHLLETVPADITRFDVDVADGALTYLGNRVDKPRLSPGAVVTITHYWKVNRPIAAAAKWRPFTLVRGLPNTADFINVAASDMMIGHPPKAWKAGQIVEDPHAFAIRPDWTSRTAKVLVGFIEEGKHGPLDRIAVAGQRTEDRAIVAANLDIDLSRAPPRPGTVHIPKATNEIVIDGVASEPSWTQSAMSPEFVTAEGSPDPLGKASAKLLWDDRHLYVFAQVSDTDIYSPYKQKDEPLWKADCVELFIDADANRRGYIELQVSPNNVQFDSWFAGTRAQPGDEKWDAGMTSAVKVRGNASTPSDSGDVSWDVEIAIPWAAIKGRDDGMKINTPPHVGDQWRLNIVRVDKRSVGNTGAASSWNRISQSDYHALDRMLVAKFADATGSLVPSLDVGSGSAGSGSAGSAGSASAGSGSGSAGSASAGSSRGSAGSGSAGGNAGSAAPVRIDPSKIAPVSAQQVPPESGPTTPAGSAKPATPTTPTTPAGSAKPATTPTTPAGSAKPATATTPTTPAGSATPK